MEIREWIDVDQLVVDVHGLEYHVVPGLRPVHPPHGVIQLLLDIQRMSRNVIEGIHHRIGLAEVSIGIVRQRPVCTDEKMLVDIISHIQAVVRHLDQPGEILDVHVVSQRQIFLQIAAQNLFDIDFLMVCIADHHGCLDHILFIYFFYGRFQKPVTAKQCCQLLLHAVKLFLHKTSSPTLKIRSVPKNRDICTILYHRTPAPFPAEPAFSP